jgi:hypothetical protein
MNESRLLVTLHSEAALFSTRLYIDNEGFIFVSRNGIATEAPLRVHIYLDSTSLALNANGPSLTICSEIQAYIDLGCTVEFINIRRRDNLSSLPSGNFKQLQYSVIDASDVKAPRYARPAYWAGWPRELTLQQQFPARNLLLREVEARMQQDASAIHVFHYLNTANVITSLPTARTIRERSGLVMILSQSIMRGVSLSIKNLKSVSPTVGRAAS